MTGKTIEEVALRTNLNGNESVPFQEGSEYGRFKIIQLLRPEQIVNALNSTATNQPLSANQGRVLKGLIDRINRDFGLYSATTNVVLSQATAGKYIDNTGALVTNASYGISAPVSLAVGDILLIPSASAVLAECSVVSEPSETTYTPLMKRVAAGLADAGYYVFLATKAGSVVISGLTATVNGGTCVKVSWDIFKTIAQEMADLGADYLTRLATKANIDGYYEGMTVGTAQNLEGRTTVEGEFLARTAGGDADISNGPVQLRGVKGKSLKFNQLVNTGASEVATTSGHKYLKRINGTNTIVTSDGSAIAINDPTEDNVFDLTAMGIDNLTTVEQVEAWLEANIGAQPYYDYNPGEVVNVNLQGVKGIGRNLLDPATGTAPILGVYSEDYDAYYGITGTHGALTFTDGWGNTETITPDADGKFLIETPGTLTVATPGADCSVFLWWDGSKPDYSEYETSIGRLDVTHIWGKKNGAGELVRVWPTGMPGFGGIMDSIGIDDDTPTAYKNIGSRAYTSGDENDSSVLTDGTTTYYNLDTPEVYTDLVYMGSEHFADGTPVVLPVSYTDDNWGIEVVLPENGSTVLTAAPTIECLYSIDAVETLDTLQTEIDNLDARKVNPSGYYPDLAVGSAKSLEGSAPVDAEFMYRPTGSPDHVASGIAIIQTIKGKTLKWNQLVNPNYAESSKSENNVTYTKQTTGTIHFVIGSGGASANTLIGLGTILPSNNGHKYLARVLSTQGENIYLRDTQNGKNYSSEIFTNNYNNYNSFSIRINSGVAEGTYDVIPIIFDLTEKFGSGNEPTTVAEFEALYPLPYYAYNPGELLPLKATGLETVGFNQWDEEEEAGYYNVETGAKVGSDSYRRSKNMIPCFPSTTYYIKGTNFRFVFYDAAGNYVGYLTGKTNTTFTTPSGAYYMVFYSEMANVVIGSVCINLSDPTRNGTYEPYQKVTLPLPLTTKTGKLNGVGESVIPFADGMNAVGSVYDEANKTKGHKRIQRYALSNVPSWVLTSDGRGFTSSALSTLVSATSGRCVICNKYGDINAVTSDQMLRDMPDKTIAFKTNGNLFVKDSAYTYAADFKASLSDVYIIFVLATPEEYVWDEPLEVTYQEDGGGTEKCLPEGVDERGVPATAPLRMSVTYPIDAVTTLLNLPRDYDTTASLDALCSALATALSGALNGTLAITRGEFDSANNKYSWSVTYTPAQE